MKRSLVVLIVLALLGCRKAQSPAAAPATGEAKPPGQVSAEIKLSTSQLTPNQSYTVTYVLHNRADFRVTVQRLETNSGSIGPGHPAWRQAVVEPGQTVTVAQAAAKSGPTGSQSFTASFVTDRGAYPAAPARLVVAAVAVPTDTGAVTGSIQVAPNPIQPGQTAVISYELDNRSAQEVRVFSVTTDSGEPVTQEHPNWVKGQIAPKTKAVVARWSTVRSQPGSRALTAEFATSRGVIRAPPVNLMVVPPPPPPDTGQVTVAIVITPNPVKLEQQYRIEYQVVNPTQQEVTVSDIQTDVGPFNPQSPEWLSSTAPPGRTTTIARVVGTGAAIGARPKHASFTTSVGALASLPVLLTVLSPE